MHNPCGIAGHYGPKKIFPYRFRASQTLDQRISEWLHRCCEGTWSLHLGRHGHTLAVLSTGQNQSSGFHTITLDHERPQAAVRSWSASGLELPLVLSDHDEYNTPSPKVGTTPQNGPLHFLFSFELFIKVESV
jgi:hypothetical protein